MTIVLKHQLEASEKSAEQLEGELQRQHHGAMLCYDVQDLMQSLVALFQTINRDVERWQGEFTAKPELRAELENVGLEWEGLYRRLAAIFDRTAPLLVEIERLGFILQNKPAFLSAWKELRGIICFSYQELATAVDQIRHGESKPLQEVMNELWDHPFFCWRSAATDAS
jgi:hypothetical protein